MEISHLSLMNGEETLHLKLSKSDIALLYLFFGTQDVSDVADEFMTILEDQAALDFPITDEEAIGAASDAVNDLHKLQKQIIKEFGEYVSPTSILSQIPVWSFPDEEVPMVEAREDYGYV